MQHPKDNSRNQTHHAYPPNPEEGSLDVVFNFHTGKSCSQEGRRDNRADKGCTVAADHHNDCRMGRIDAKLIANSNQYRKQAEEVGIRAE